MTGLEIAVFLLGVCAIVGSFFLTQKLSGEDINEIQKLGQAEIKTIVDKELKDAKERISSTIDESLDESFEKVERKTDKETNSKIQEISEYSDTVLTSMNKSHDEIIFMYDMLNKKQEEVTKLIEKQEEILSVIRNIKDEIDKKEKQYLNTVSKEKQKLNKEKKDFEDYKDSIERKERVKKSSKALEIVKEGKNTEAASKKDEIIEDIKPLKTSSEVLKKSSNTKKKSSFPETFKNNYKKINEEGASALNTQSKKEAIIKLHKEGYTEIDIAKKMGLGIGEIKLILGLFNKG